MKWAALLLTASAGHVALGKPAPETKAGEKRQEGFQWVGVNESGAEFGEDTIPGELGTDYTWPDQETITTLAEDGMNIFRVAFLMERLFDDSLTGSMNETYLGDLVETINFITDQGAHAIVDPHNFGRYQGSVIESADDFGAFWETLAGSFVDNDLVVFDTNNEYHDMDQELVLNLNQAAIDGIREAGATEQYIFVEGNSYSGAWTWTENNDNLKDLTDPSDKLVYEMHQYLDEDGSGTNEDCVSETIGAERVADATEWLRSNGKVGIIGEFAGAANDVCEAAVSGMLDSLAEDSDVWLGAIWWAAGPWWADYMFSIEVPDGVAVEPYLPILQEYV